MLLAIDIGNTNVTLGLFRAGALAATRRAATHARADGRRAGAPPRRRSSGSTTPSFADVSAIALRVGRAGPHRRHRGDRRAPRAAAPRRGAGTVPLAIRIDRPDEVGADRLVNALAAARLHGTPAVVVDFGTATTLDCVAADGAYVGGAIAPGLELGLEALAARTAKLPRIELRSAGPGDRPRHRQRDAVRHDLRLPGAGRRAARPRPARARRRGRHRAAPTSRRS